MARTKAAAVQAVLRDPSVAGDYDGVTDLTPYIDTANSVVNRLVTCAVQKKFTISDSDLELIERWLAAHFYGQADKTLSSKSTGGASGSFQGQTGMGLTTTFYGQSALRIDYTGCLEVIDKRKVAGGMWGGKTINQQLTYDERN